MLTRVPESGPRPDCRRHAVLLAAAIFAIALTRSSSAQAPIALAFACYGALHAAALSLSLRPRPAGVRALGFVAAAALLSGCIARLGSWAAPILAGGGVKMAAIFLIAASAFGGALGYGALLRWLLRHRLAPGPLLLIALACLSAATAALLPLRQYPVGGTAWLAIFWWLAFSGGLCVADGQRARSDARASRRQTQ